uniref:H(+)-exporting diphosphatase n=1 Tax=Zea mays TaxID=4577 RepID=A0A804QCV6_MAIZE
MAEGIALRGYIAVTFDMRDIGRRGSSDNVAKTTWRDVSYQITKINMYKDGRHVQDMLKHQRLHKAALLELTDSLSRTYALGAADNTTVAIRKGFAIGSGALVSLVLFGAFVSRAGVKSVGSVALKMVEEVRRQFNTILGLME